MYVAIQRMRNSVQYSYVGPTLTMLRRLLLTRRPPRFGRALLLSTQVAAPPVAQVDAALRRMAAKVDAQNAGDPAYRAMAGRETQSLAYQAARALVFSGVDQPNGYTEPLLHHFRRLQKAG